MLLLFVGIWELVENCHHADSHDVILDLVYFEEKISIVLMSLCYCYRIVTGLLQEIDIFIML